MQSVVNLFKSNALELVLGQQIHKLIHERVVKLSKDDTRWCALERLASPFDGVHLCPLNIELPDIGWSGCQNGIDRLYLYPLQRPVKERREYGGHPWRHRMTLIMPL